MEGLDITDASFVPAGDYQGYSVGVNQINDALAAANAAAGITAASLGLGTVGAAAMCTATGRAVTASLLQALSTAQKAGGLSVPQGLAGTVPTSQSALITAARQSISAANQAARSNPAIARPAWPGP